MKYTYIGMENTIQGYAIIELSIKKTLEEKCDVFLYKASDVDIKDVIDKIMGNDIENLIIDIETFNNTEKDIVKGIEIIRKAKNCDVYIVAKNYSEESKVISILKGLGYTKIITADTQGEIRNDFLKMINLLCEYKVDEEYLQLNEAYAANIQSSNPSLNKIEPSHKGILTIGVAGCMPRIGTTTSAIQLAKTLNLTGENNACVIEVNNHKYTDTLLKVADPKSYKLIEHDGININNINIYTDLKKTHAIKKQEYKYLVYDYGNIDLNEDNSVFDKDIVIFVCGYSPEEILNSTKITTTCVSDCGLINVFYLYNYISDRQYQEILEMQSPLIKGYTYKLDFTPDMYELNCSNLETFKQILELASLEKNTKKKGVLSRLLWR